MAARLLGRSAAAAVSLLVLASLVAPGIAAAAGPAYGFSQSSPTPATVNYSDLVTFTGAYTCLNGGDSSSLCPTTSLTETATFALRPSGGSTFTTVATVLTSFTFTSSSAGCPTACTRPFQVVWKAGRAGSLPVPPGTYDVRLTTTIAAGEDVRLGALVVTPESTTTSYTGGLAGDEGTALALAATVADSDHGLSSGTGLWSPDVYLGASASVSFSLYDSTNTTLVAGPVTASLSSFGATTGSPTLTLPSAGTYQLRTEYSGNTYYTASSDLDTITANPVNTPPTLGLPGSMTVEAGSAAGAVVAYSVTASDAEDNPDPSPSCDPSSGATFPLGTTTVDCSVTDSGGLTTTGSFDVSVVDTTDPEVHVGSAESAGSSGWYNAGSNDATPGVTVDVSAVDLVGVTDLACTDNGLAVTGLAASGGSFVVGDGTHVVSCTARDAAGNTAGDSATFDVDQTPPTGVSFDGGGLSDGAAYVFGAVPDGPTGCTADFDVSGPGECLVTGYSNLVGDQAVTATATDAAGNVATAELHYTVQPWTLVGFAKPVRMDSLNAEKAGRDLTLKFEAWAGPTQLVDPAVVASVTQTPVSCSTQAALAGSSPAATLGGVVYAPGPRTFSFDWLSPAASGTCWVVTLTTLDGSSLAAAFQMR